MTQLESGFSLHSRQAWYALAIFFLACVTNYADRYALAALAPLVKADLGLSDSQIGILTGLSFAAFYALCGIPLARAADRGDRRSILTWSLAAWSVMTALCGAAQNFWHILLARMGVGVGEAGANPTIHTMICDYFPLQLRPAAFSAIGVGGFVGMAIGLGAAGQIGELWGWRVAFITLGLPGLILAVLVRFTIREPKRGQFDTVTTSPSLSLAELVLRLLRSRSYRIILCYVALNAFAMSAFGQWWPSYFNRAFSLDPGRAGLYLGMIVGGGAVTGVAVGAWLAHYFVQRNSLALVWLPLVAIGCAAPVAAASLVAPSIELALTLVLMINFLWSVPNGSLQTLMYAVCPLEHRAAAAAIIFFVTAIVGYGCGPLAVGILSDALGAGGEGLRLALALPTAALFLMFSLLGSLLTLDRSHFQLP